VTFEIADAIFHGDTRCGQKVRAIGCFFGAQFEEALKGRGQGLDFEPNKGGGGRGVEQGRSRIR
jgi:hypothetical protein